MVLSTYLVRTAITGGLLGGVHGLMTLDRSMPGDWGRAVHVGYHIQVGAVLGPWFPVAVPLWFMLDGGANKTGCPPMKGGMPMLKQTFGDDNPPQEGPELPTVAEKP